MVQDFHQADAIPPQVVIAAYGEGYFPMGDPISGEVHWYRPRERGIVPLDRPLRVARSLLKTIRREPFRIACDTDFEAVIRACAAPRWWKGQTWLRPGPQTAPTAPTPAATTAPAAAATTAMSTANPVADPLASVSDAATPQPAFARDTWLTESLVRVYTQLHGMGLAHSIEAWRDGQLVGGLYGVALGGAFFGESMFVRPQCGGTDASKICLVALFAHLRAQGFTLFDAQMMTSHLARFGCQPIRDRPYRTMLWEALARDDVRWGQFDAQALLAPYRRPGRRPEGITGA